MEMSALDCVQEDNITKLLALCNHMKTLASIRNSNNNNNDDDDDENEYLEERDMYGNTALLKACFMGRLQCVQILLNFGASIYGMNYFAQNALTLATYSGNLAIIRLLLNYRTYVDFNKSSIVPAICVAALCQNEQLLAFYATMEEGHDEGDLDTSHDLSAEMIKEMVKKVNSSAL